MSTYNAVTELIEIDHKEFKRPNDSKSLPRQARIRRNTLILNVEAMQESMGFLVPFTGEVKISRDRKEVVILYPDDIPVNNVEVVLTRA